MSKKELSISDRLIYSSWDIQQALSALTFLLEECDYDKTYNHIALRRFRCFETTLIIAFARPFKVGRGRKSLDLSAIGFEFTEDELRLKKKLEDLRDKVVGHSDEEEMVYKTYSFKPFDDHEVLMPVEYFQETLLLSEEEVRKIELLLLRMKCAIAEYKFKLVQKNPEVFNRCKQRGK